MLRWAVIVDDPEALRAHYLEFESTTRSEAERTAAIAASHADIMESRQRGEIDPQFRASSALFAVAFPLKENGELDRESGLWPENQAGEPMVWTPPPPHAAVSLSRRTLVAA